MSFSHRVLQREPQIVEDMEKHPEKLELIGELQALMESHLVILKRCGGARECV